jgi:hypothetical protein
MMLPTRWSHLARCGLLGTSLVAAASEPAAAERCDDRADRSISLVIGLDLSPRVRVFGGIEGRICANSKTELMARLELGAGSPRLIGGARVRPFENGDYIHTDHELLGLEVGALIDIQGRGGFHGAATYGRHFAYLALQAMFPAFATSADAPPLEQRTSVVAGLSPWTMAEATVVEGRPILHDGQIVRPAIAALAAARDAEARAVRDHFAGAAQVELSSVWTFLRLAAELAAVGAPASLVAAALDAAEDEVRHAELCGQAAGGLTLAMLPMSAAQPRFTARTPDALARLAVEAWCEGCLNEGAASEEARLAAAEATGSTRAMLDQIARDEAGHAEMSWAVLAWLVETAPTTVRDALAALPPAAPLAATPYDVALARHGVPSPALTAAARAHTDRVAHARRAALLG